MALVRCRQHQPQGRKEPYVVNVKPVGYPDTAAICGLQQWENPGLVWLRKAEYEACRSGGTVFEPHTHAVKIRTEPYQP